VVAGLLLGAEALDMGCAITEETAKLPIHKRLINKTDFFMTM